LPTMDYLHRTSALTALPQQVTHGAISEMAKLAYGRWSQGLGAGMALAVTLVATVSFNIVNYLTVTFGESFSYYPLLGVIAALAIAVAAFFWGALRSVYHILLEIEDVILRLTI